MKLFKYIKSTIIGLLMMLYAYYIYHTSDIVIDFECFDFWVIMFNAIVGFILLFTGDKHINNLIEIIFNDFIYKYIKKTIDMIFKKFGYKDNEEL